MTEHARIKPIGRGRAFSRRGAARKNRREQHYFAFLSYSHRDEEMAQWLHDQLERFRVPAALVGQIRDHGVVPRRLTPIFRDQQELAAADDLGEEIEAALSGSQYLIVLCSPDAAKSHWTNAEVDAFKRVRPDGCVLAAIAAGEPFASEIEGREDEECFPPALRKRYDRMGRPTSKRAEPLAADLRADGDARRTGFLKLVAGMLGVGLDDLVQRETTRRQRRLAFVTAASIAGMALTSVLAVTALRARDEARDERREAEGLVAFMLGDLKDKLEPIGRLDALDGVGAKVLDYYRKQDASDLPDNALLQRAQALSLSAQVAYLRGNFVNAERLYREALSGTAEAVQRDPEDPQRLFDHAQNAYWLGAIAMQQGRLDEGTKRFREYQRLAQRMVAAEPDNMKWRMESLSADVNLGIVLNDQRRFAEAAPTFRSALDTIAALNAADPGNREYQINHLETLAWYAQALQNGGDLRQAASLREQHVALAKRYDRLSSGDVKFRQRLIPSYRTLGNIKAAFGDPAGAARDFQSAVDIGKELIAAEPGNSRWADFTALSRLNLASHLSDARRPADARAEVESGCSAYASLTAKEPKVAAWQDGLTECHLTRAKISYASGDAASALNEARRAFRLARTMNTTDKVARAFKIAAAQRLIGDSQRRLGDQLQARQAWESAYRAIPKASSKAPDEIFEEARILQRLGRQSELAPIAGRLKAMGYRHSLEGV